MSFNADDVYQKGLEARFYFLEGRKKGICPECHQEKLILPSFGMCLECIATRKAWDVCNNNGDISKPYIKAVLNDGRVRPEVLTVDVVASIWEDIKSDYYRQYLKALESEAVKPKEPFPVPYDS